LPARGDWGTLDALSSESAEPASSVAALLRPTEERSASDDLPAAPACFLAEPRRADSQPP